MAVEEMANRAAAAWYESEGLRLALAAISGGVGTRVIDNIFRWRSEGADVEGKKIDIEAKASAQWRELFETQTKRLEEAETRYNKEIADLKTRVRDLENELRARQNPFPQAPSSTPTSPTPGTGA
jgi:polyhydroxyalkanoate synthesis regulator phasin